MTHSEWSDTADTVAVIGMAGRFPGAASVAEFWQSVRSGRPALTRWDASDVEEPADVNVTSPDYVPVKGYLDGSTRFREDLFGVSPAEAAVLDPQIRLLLETAWAALDDAGVGTSPEDIADVGVFVSAATSEHALAAQTDRALARRLGALQVKLLTDKDFAATWLAYRLNLGGPGVTVQTACSSSLVAVHQAATSVLLGECRAALAGGVCVDTDRRAGYQYVAGGIASRSGSLRPFDVASDGAVGGNGVGVVVLKRLDDALADGDRIDAVLLGSAVNNDGRAKVGFTAPGVDGHARAIVGAWHNAGRDMAEMSYFEAHGTGTNLGDPIEIAAFAQACATTGARPDAAVGSVKGTIGHLDTAAGVAAMIKAVCMLRARQLVPTAGLRVEDPVLDFPGRGLRVQSKTADFPADRQMLIGVSSLGIGGTNVHVVLGEAPPRTWPTGTPGPQLLPVSVQTSADLPGHVAALGAALSRTPVPPIDAVASTLQTGRRELGVRAFVVAGSAAEAAAEFTAGRAPELPGTGQVGFVFPGQTARYRRPGSGMYERFPAYRRALDSFSAVLRDYGIDPLADHDVNGTDYWQPTLVAHQLALVELLRAHGLHPSAVAGHSIGELSAAVAHGVFAPEPVLRAVAARGRLMQATAPGAMLAIKVGEQHAAELVTARVSLAAVNGPARCVLAGPADAIDAVASRCDDRGWDCALLPGDRAFHSSLMDPILDGLHEVMSELVATAADGDGGDWLSSVTGQVGSSADIRDADYWVRQARAPVRWVGAAALVADRVDGTLLEVGIGGDLTFLAHLGGPVTTPTVAAQGRSPHDEVRWYLDAVGVAWRRGTSVRWTELGPDRRRIALPTHPFDGRDYGALRLGNAPPALPAAPAFRADSALPEPPTGPYPASDAAEIVRSVLGVTAAELDGAFLELGGDSLKAVQVVGRLRDELGLTLSMQALLTGSSVAEVVHSLSAGEDDNLLNALRDVLADDGAGACGA